MKLITPALLMTVFALASCSQHGVANGKNQKDHFADRVTYTGSNIPQDPNRVTYGPLAATAPSQGVARDHPSLYPTDPVVGANAGNHDTGDYGPNRNVGAGPAGSNSLPTGN